MKIFCVGRNYLEHAKELNSAVPTEPVIFMKPATALTIKGRPFFLPDFSENVHYEGELVLKVCKNGKHIAEKFAPAYFDQITVGIDFTARDLQNKLKDKGLPWEISKGFDGSAVIGKFIPVNELADINHLNFSLQKNGQVVQQGSSSEMIFSFSQVIAYISRFFTIQAGDLIFTGTPSGVGKIELEDYFEGFIGETKVMKCKVK